MVVITTIPSTSASARVNDAGSVALTPNRMLVSRRVTPSAETTPTAAPIAPSRRPRPRNVRTTDSPVAPGAMRMPISCVLCLTMYDTRPYVPIAASAVPVTPETNSTVA